MAINGSRLQVNTNGSVPLADTVGGAAGTVTGTERNWLQSALARFGAASVAGYFPLLPGQQVIVRPTVDNDATEAVQLVNAANTIQKWKITQGGQFSGNAATATTAASVPGVGTLATVTLPGVTTVAYTGQIIGLALPAGGTWLVFHDWTVTNNVSTQVQGYVNGTPQGPLHYSKEANGVQTGSNMPIVASGGQSVTYNNLSPSRDFSHVGTGIRAVRIG